MEPGLDPCGEDLRAASAGDASALARWYQSEHPQVWRLCLGLLADRAEADDTAQDAMVRLWEQAARWTGDQPYGAWRTKVVLNVCRDRCRRRGARARAEEEAARRRLPDVLPDPSVEIENAEIVQLVASSLGQLSPREREVFVLHDLQGEGSGAVARALGLGDGAVRAVLALARRRLRGLLAKRVPSECV